MDDTLRRTADYLRSTSDLTEYFKACREMGDLALVESALLDIPEWATFHEVKSALGSAGLRFCIATLAPQQRASPAAAADRRKGPRMH